MGLLSRFKRCVYFFQWFFVSVVVIKQLLTTVHYAPCPIGEGNNK